jgi:transposase
MRSSPHNSTAVRNRARERIMRQRDLLRRIGLIRYVYKIAERQAAGPAPYSAVAVLTFYDVIEWFLITACEHLDVKVKKGSGIYDYFDRIERNKKIFGKTLVNKVSSSRNELKHRLTIPSEFSVKETQFAAQNFLEENCSRLFDIRFVDASMSDLIANELVAASLREARSLMDNSDFQAAMGRISEAFQHLSQEFRLNLMPSWVVACGADELSLFYFTRNFAQIDKKREFAIEPCDETCQFCYDLLVETTIRVEQTFAGNVKRLEAIFARRTHTSPR